MGVFGVIGDLIIIYPKAIFQLLNGDYKSSDLRFVIGVVEL